MPCTTHFRARALPAKVAPRKVWPRAVDASRAEPAPTRSQMIARLLCWRSQAGFELGHLGFQCLQARTGAGQHDHLAVEFVAAYHIELAQGALQQGLELALDLGLGQRRVLTEQPAGLLSQGIAQRTGRGHGLVPALDRGPSVAQRGCRPWWRI